MSWAVQGQDTVPKVNKPLEERSICDVRQSAICRDLIKQVLCVQVLTCNITSSPAVRPRPSNRNRRAGVTLESLAQFHRQLKGQAQALKGQTDVVFLGDSITESYRGTDFNQPCPQDRCAGVPAIFRKHFGRRALALGIAADETQHLLWRLKDGEMGSLQPRAVVVLMGTNNFGIGNMSSLEVAQGVAAVVEVLLQRDRSSEVLVMGVLPRAKHGTFRVRIRRANALLQTMCAHNNRLTFVDCSQVFMGPDRVLNRSRMDDLLHPNAVGLDAMFGECLRPTVEQMMMQKMGEHEGES